MTEKQPDLTEYGAEIMPKEACINYEECGNMVPQNARICGNCLDRVRKQDRERANENEMGKPDR